LRDRRERASSLLLVGALEGDSSDEEEE